MKSVREIFHDFLSLNSLLSFHTHKHMDNHIHPLRCTLNKSLCLLFFFYLFVSLFMSIELLFTIWLQITFMAHSYFNPIYIYFLNIWISCTKVYTCSRVNCLGIRIKIKQIKRFHFTFVNFVFFEFQTTSSNEKHHTQWILKLKLLVRCLTVVGGQNALCFRLFKCHETTEQNRWHKRYKYVIPLLSVRIQLKRHWNLAPLKLRQLDYPEHKCERESWREH